MHYNKKLEQAIQIHRKEFDLSVDQICKTIFLVLTTYEELGGDLNSDDQGAFLEVFLHRMKTSMSNYRMQCERLSDEES